LIDGRFKIYCNAVTHIQLTSAVIMHHHEL
jgi:hypothetical protein